MKMYLSIFFALAFIALNAQNQGATEQKHVEVTGTAEMEIVPNEIMISITLQEEKDGNKRSVEEQEKLLINVLKKQDIDLKNLRLSDVGSYTRWDKKTKESYKQKTFMLTLHSAEEASTVLYQLNQLEIFRMYVANTSHSEIEDFKKEVKINAVKAAKEKAQYLLEAVDEKLGNVIYIKEQDNSYYSGYRSGVANMAMESDSYQANPEVEFKKIKLQYKIIARFEIQ